MEYDQTYTGTSGNDNIDIPTLFPDLVNNTWSIDALEGDDIIVGGSNNDRINGGEGADMMSGGEGDDLFFVDQVGDRVMENAGEGIDRVITSIDNYVLGDHVEELNLRGNAFTGYGNSLDNLLIGHFNTDDSDILFGGGGNDKIAGHGGNDKLHGEEGNDLLNGGQGEDYMSGGEGNDIFLVDNVRDEVIENVGEGTDTVKTSLNSYFLADNVERLELIGNAEQGYGNTLDNVLVGHVGTNTTDELFGDLGDDTIAGDDGDDYLYGEEGRDFIKGGDGDDELYGGSDDDRLDGQGGDDWLDGGTGADIMRGGIGGDVYVVDNVRDEVIENAEEGTDLVRVHINNYVLPDNVENLFLQGNEAINGHGNELDNTLMGYDVEAVDEYLDGKDGNDWLAGRYGADTLIGGEGDDFIDGGKGSDIDSLVGGNGNDSYVVYNNSDIIVEDAGQGSDTILTDVNNYVLPDNVENLTLFGDAVRGHGNSLSNVLTGNDLGNLLRGYDGWDTLDGGAGDDVFHGGIGNDSLLGGVGNDILTGNEGNDILDGGAGDDSLFGSNDNDHLFGGTGDDYLSGGTGDDSLKGEDGNDTLTGNEGNDSLKGGANNDYLMGYNGYFKEVERDYLVGDNGADTFVLGDSAYREWGNDTFYQGLGYARIGDFNRYEGDRIQVSKYTSLDDYTVTPGHSGLTTEIRFNGDLIGLAADDSTDIVPSEDFIFV